MAISTEEIVRQLTAFFPDRIIYKQEFSYKYIGYALDRAIRSAFKAENISRAQWLQKHGFDWRETGYIEKDMRSDPAAAIDSASAFALGKSVVYRYPLLGEYEPSPAEMDMLMNAAQDVFQKMTLEHAELTFEEQAVLTFTTIQLLKNWTTDGAEVPDDSEDGASDNGFWNYIYLQYGFKPEDSEVAEQRIYSRFRKAIKATLQGTKKKRFMTSEGHKYYTTLLLHAIAPEQSIRNLYDILFDFYISNLDYQYVPNDPIYGAFVKGMQRRWNGSEKKKDALQLRSDVVFSGLKALFMERPGYMANVCDGLVRNIDRLVRDVPFESTTRWESLLQAWFQDKTHDDKSSVQSAKRQHREGFVATTADRIIVRYIMEDGCVGLEIPKIRLAAFDTEDRPQSNERPQLYVYQNDREICSRVMNVAGNELGETTRRIFLPLGETELRFDKPLGLRVEIRRGGGVLFSTELSEKYILFGSNGRKCAGQKGTAYLFTDETSDVGFANDDEVYQENHPGQLWCLELDRVGAVTVNGTEIFADEQQAGKVRLYPSVKPIRGIRAVVNGAAVQIFDGPFDVFLRIPEKDNRLRYRVSLDDASVAIDESRSSDAERILSVETGEKAGRVRTIRIFDHSTSANTLEFRFVILPGFSCKLDKPYYLDEDRTAVLTVRDDSGKTDIPMIRPDGSDTAVSAAAYLGLSLEADLPAVHAAMGEGSLFELAEKLWYASIEKSNFVRLSLPDGWDGELRLGETPIEPNASGDIELGNFLHSGRRFGNRETLKLTLSHDQMAHTIPLTEIVFAPTFSRPPLIAERGHLNWVPDGIFFGDPGSRFLVSVRGKKELSFELGTKNCGLAGLADAPQGIYGYTVSLISAGLFAKGAATEIFSGEFIHGDKNALRFENKEIVLTTAIYWDIKEKTLKSATVRRGAAVLASFVYVGESIPSGETIPLPEYDAALFFETPDGRRIPFCSDESREDYELINPARVWIVNDRRLILRAVTDDAVYFDTMRNSIVSRTADTMKPPANRLQNPDYFDYEAKEL